MTLTKRELEVISMVCDGIPQKAIGAELNLSGKTVAFHLSKIYRKLGITGRGIAKLVKVAIKNGWTTV